MKRLNRAATRYLLGTVTACGLAVWWGGDARAAGTACESFAAFTLPNVTITLAQPVMAGAPLPTAAQSADDDTPPARPSTAPRAFCRVAATLKPSADSDIKMEVWMPVDWNGKFD